MAMKWYVIRTYAGCEEKVKNSIEHTVKTKSLQEKFGKIIIPTEDITVIKKGKRGKVTKQLFPTYILIEIEPTDEIWQVVATTPGVMPLLGTKKQPQPLRGTEVEQILSQVEREKPSVYAIHFKKGESVKIVDGPFTNFVGTIEEIDSLHGKLRVMVTIFGRATPIELDFLQVKAL
ncbi:MAG: transcription termination/antitermination protein NusG [Candidatus Edwardsbacteria bacterium]